MTWALASAIVAQSAGVAPFLTEPDIHGDRIVFTCEGDLWLGSLRGGTAERLTRDEGTEMDARFSPDGSRIAFTAEYDGIREVYVMPVAGGAPKRLTYTGVVGEALDWTPDGRRVLYRTVDAPNNVVFRTVPAEGGASTPLPIEFGAAASFSKEGRLAFTRFARYNEPWYGYEGGLKNDVWLAEPGLRSFRRVATAKGSLESPVWLGDRIAYVEDAGGRFSVMSVRPDGKEPRRLAGPYDVEVRELASDGNRLVYEKGTGLETFDPATGKATPVGLSFASDLLHARPFRVPASDLVFSYSPAPGGKRAYAESRGQIVALPVDGKGEARVVLARDGVRFSLPEPSPDGKRLAYLSDESGEQALYVADESGEQALYVADAGGVGPVRLTLAGGRQVRRVRWTPDGRSLLFADSDAKLWAVPAAGGTPTLVATGSGREGPEFDVSPDSKWVAYAVEDFTNLTSSIFLYSMADGRTVRVSSGLTDDFTPAFTKDGRFLAFLSRRVLTPRTDELTSVIGFPNSVRPYLFALRKEIPSPFAPEDAEPTPPVPAGPFRIDLDGLADRVVEVPVPAGRLSGLEAGRSALYWVEGDGTLAAYDLDRKAFARMAPGDGFRLTPSGDAVLVTQGARARIVAPEVRPAPEGGAVTFGALSLRIDPVAEWRQIFWEGWRYARDYFYVRNMHGLDWRKVGEKYAAQLPRVRSRGEVDRLFRGMLGELNVSHARTTAGASRVLKARTPAAFLGADFEPGPSGARRIVRILRGDGINATERSPLAEPGLNLKPGDYVLEVAGQPAGEESSLEEALAGRAGETVSLLVNSVPSREGARRILVRPIASEFRLRYDEWVRGRREEVARLSGGRVGYVHLLSMTNPEMADFLRQYLPQRNRQALVIDVRFNTGGYISSGVIAYLRQRLVSYFNLRSNDSPTSRQIQHFDGPMVCLINEFSKSNGEEFPFQFRAEGLGKIVGRRTWGGEVGSDPGWPLVDGGKIWVPNYGAWTPEKGWIIEGTGVSPDIDVESDPNLFAKGVDPQLQRGVKELLDALAAKPPVPVRTPSDPVRTRSGPVTGG